MKMDLRNIRLVRRDVLKLSAAAIAAPPFLAATISDRAGRAPIEVVRAVDRATWLSAAPRVSVGYWDGRLASSFVDARQVGDADLRMERGARLSISGSYEDSTSVAWAGFGSVSLSFDLRPFHAGELLAWHYQSSPVANVSAVTTINLPVDRAGGFTAWVDFLDANPGATPVRAPIRFGLDGSRGKANLRTGYYVIALAEAYDRRGVAWESMRLQPTSGGDSLILSDRQGRVFDRPHMIIEADSM